MRNFRYLLKAIIILLICNLQYIIAETDLKTETFGSRLDAAPINNGFLFIENEYIDTPYKVTSKGLGIYVNNRLVDKIHLPPYYGYENLGNTDPVMPTNITKNTSRYDPVYKKYIQHKFAFVRKNYPNQLIEKKIEIYQSLPNIEKVEMTESSGIIIVHTYKEGPVRTNINIHGRRVKTDINSITQRVEHSRQFYIRNLKAKHVLFVNACGGMKKGFANNPTKLSKILKLRNKNIANLPHGKQRLQAQADEVTTQGLNLSPDMHENLLTNFVASPQLEERIQNLMIEEEANNN